jgi:FdhD protein
MIYLNGKLIAISQATPRNLEELAVGFLLSEGLIIDRNLFTGVNLDTESHEVYVFTDEKIDAAQAIVKNMTSSGAALRLDPDSGEVNLLPKNTSELRLSASGLLVCMETLCEDSPLRNSGECTHACGLGADELECVREDIGRHNALDKLFGQAWLDELPLDELAVFTTGRISYEVLLKAARAGMAIVVSRKGITDSAVDLAQKLGITTVAYCRDDSMSVYTYPERIINK